jgi:formamidase
MPNTLISVDLRRSPEEQSPRPHNRWHPEIPPVAEADPGAVFRIECLDATGGQVLNSDSADDVGDLDLDQMLYASGPVAITGARPGDLLAVDILDIGSLPGAEWGYTAVLNRAAELGSLADPFPEARKAIWDLNGVLASSRHIEGVRLTGRPHPGLIGCAPSAEQLSRWNDAERAASSAVPRASGGEGALLGSVPEADYERVLGEAASTWETRENGGRLDGREMVPGSRIFLPVFVPGANLSVGDLHFSGGDGQITGFGGVRMAGWIDLRVDVIPDGMRRYEIYEPVIEQRLPPASHCDTLVFQGLAPNAGGRAGESGVRAAHTQACRNAIRHLQRFGYSGEQAYALLAAAPVWGRITSFAGWSNVCYTLEVPTEIFDFGVGVESDGSTVPRGELATPS